MNKALVIIGVLVCVVLLAGCTSAPSGTSNTTSNVGSLGDFPNISGGGLNELGNLPSVNQSVTIGSGLVSSNPFPDQPNLQ